MMRAIWLALLVSCAVPSVRAEDVLPGTDPLEWQDEDFSIRIMDGAHAFVEGQLAKAREKRKAQWRRSPLAAGDSEEKLKAHRDRLREVLGVVDELAPTRLEFVSSESPGFDGEIPSSLVSESEAFQVHQVRWDVIDGLVAEGLYASPIPTEEFKTESHAVVVIPDAGETPEDLFGLTNRLEPEKQMGLRFAAAGYRVLIPTILNRDFYHKEISHREWIYRQAFQMGRHVIGYEVQTVLAGVEWLRTSLPTTVSVAGYGEGGMLAFFSGACETGIDAVFVSGFFSGLEEPWKEPIDRNVFGMARDFGHAEIANLIFPRTLLIEHTDFPVVVDRKGAVIETPDAAAVESEINRVGELMGLLSGSPGILFSNQEKGVRAGYPAMAAFSQTIGFVDADVSRVPPIALMMDGRSNFTSEARHTRVFQQMEQVVQRSLSPADEKRREHFFYKAEPGLRPGKWSTEAEHDFLKPDAFIEKAKEFREEFASELIGEFDVGLVPLNPRSKKILDNEKWTAWDVVLDVYPRMESWGVLVVPKNLADGKRYPVVVCQHGRDGVPRDCIDQDKSAYGNFAAKLAERGYIAFAPHNLYRHEDRYRWLDRKANNLGCSLFSLIVASHRQNVDWLKSLPFVDPDRIGFYGLSYGGESAMRIPAIIEDYCLSICSGDFNQWNRKVADVNFPNGFMRTVEWEMPYWNLGRKYDYAEMAGLIFPRPFMVERGHHDRVSRDEWVAHEYAKVRWLYSQFEQADKTEIELFQGGHSIKGEGTFRFLDKWLKP